MILLSGHSLTPAAKLRPEALSVNLKERDSSATMALEDLTGITENSWIQSDKGPGAGTVWRVKSIQQSYHNKTATIQLEHAISTLNDRVLFGEIRAAQITGTLGATTCTARQAIEYILNQQSDWVLYNFSAAYESVSNPYKFDGDSLMDALETVSATLADAWWSYDMSVYPFRLNITAKESGVASELRPGRNLRTISKTVDRSGMFTRFYPIGKNDLHLTGTPYVSLNENQYGVIARIGTDQSLETAAELTAWANEQLSRHAEPVVSITAEGLEIAEATCETLDALTLGRNCRVPLNEFGTTITERIIELNYPDALFQPEMVRVTMSNKREDVTKIIADALKGAGRSARGVARRDKEDLAWFEDTNDHVAMCAKGIVGVDAQGNPNWYLLSQIIVDGTGIHQTVDEMQGDVLVSKSWIEQNGSTVTAGVAKIPTLENNNVQLEGRLDIEAGKVSLLATATDARPIVTVSSVSSLPSTGDSTKLYYCVQNKKYYEWKNGAYSETTPGNTINRAGIIASINQDGSSTTSILGDKIYIGTVDKTLNALGTDAANKTGVFADYMYVHSLTASELTTLLANIGDADIDSLNVTGHADVQSLTAEVGITAESLDASTLNDADIDDMIASASVSGNTLTLTTVGGDTITFNKATTVSGSWSGGILTVSADPNGENSYQRYFAASGDVSWTSDKKGAIAYVDVKRQSGQSEYVTDHNAFSIVVDTTTSFNEGYNKGKPVSGTAGNRTSGVSALVHDFTITKGDNTTATLQIDVTSIYSTARTGYTADTLIQNQRDYGTVSSTGVVTIYPDTGMVAMKAATINVQVPSTSYVTGNWSGGVLTVSPSSSGESSYQRFFAASGTTSWASDKKSVTAYVNVKKQSGASEIVTDYDAFGIYVDTTTSYTTGYSKGSPVSGTAGGRTSGVSALVHDFTITKGDSTTATLQIDVTNIYTTARTGYTADSSIQNQRDYGTVSSNGVVTIYPDTGIVAMKAATINVQVPTGTTRTASALTFGGYAGYGLYWNTTVTYDNSTTSSLAVDGTTPYDAGMAACWDTIGLNYSSDQTVYPGQPITIIPGGKYSHNSEYISKTAKGITITSGGSSGTYTRYNFYVSSKTQSSDGYHYTLTIGTGWSSPFASAGSNQYLYLRS